MIESRAKKQESRLRVIASSTRNLIIREILKMLNLIQYQNDVKI